MMGLKFFEGTLLYQQLTIPLSCVINHKEFQQV